MRDNELNPITPQEAKEMYLEERREDASHEALRTIENGVDLFVTWTLEEGIDNMNDIRGRKLRQYKNWCKNTTDKNTMSLNGIMSVLRRFLVFCVSIEAVFPNVPSKTPIPKVPKEDQVCYDKPSSEQVEAVTKYLETHEPCSRRHVEYRLKKELAFRTGAVRAIDEDDADAEERVIELRHRPEKEFEDEKGTPLKNGKDGERNVNISRGLADLIKRYKNSPDRKDAVDKFGRRPLLTTDDGRPTVKTIRQDIYKLTRFCEYSGDCKQECKNRSYDASKSRHASKCSTSHSPHPLRRWSIENQIENGVSKELLSDRVDVSIPVLNEHYDLRNEERKRKHRLKVYEKIFDGYGDPNATMDAGVMVDMLAKSDGTLDTEALNNFIDHSDDTDTSQSVEEKSPDVDSDQDQATFDQYFDGITSVLHPALVPVLGGLALIQGTTNRVRQELADLKTEPCAPLRPSRERIVKGTAAYAVFVGLVAFNLASVGLLPL